MSAILLKPRLTYIPLFPKTSHVGVTPSGQLDQLNRLWQPSGGGPCEIIRLGIDKTVDSFKGNPEPGHRFPLVHVDCSNINSLSFQVGMPGEGNSLTAEELADMICKLPDLKMVVLAGVNNIELPTVFLERKISVIFSVPTGPQMNALLEDFYLAVLKGMDLQKAYNSIDHKYRFGLKEISLDPIQKRLRWNERQLGATPNWAEGMVVRRLDKHKLNWRLSKPFYGMGKMPQPNPGTQFTPPVVNQNPIAPPPLQKEEQVPTSQQPIIPVPPVQEEAVNQTEIPPVIAGESKWTTPEDQTAQIDEKKVETAIDSATPQVEEETEPTPEPIVAEETTEVESTQEEETAIEETPQVEEETEVIPEPIVAEETTEVESTQEEETAIEETPQVEEETQAIPEPIVAEETTEVESTQEEETSIEEPPQIEEETEAIPEPIIAEETTGVESTQEEETAIEETPQVEEETTTTPEPIVAEETTEVESAQDEEIAIEEVPQIEEEIEAIPEPIVAEETTEVESTQEEETTIEEPPQIEEETEAIPEPIVAEESTEVESIQEEETTIEEPPQVEEETEATPETIVAEETREAETPPTEEKTEKSEPIPPSLSPISSVNGDHSSGSNGHDPKVSPPKEEEPLVTRKSPKIRRSVHEDLITEPSPIFAKTEVAKVEEQDINQQPSKLNGDKTDISPFNKLRETVPVERKNSLIEEPSSKLTQEEEEALSGKSTKNKTGRRVNKDKSTQVANPVKGPKQKRRSRRILIASIIISILATGGFWSYLQQNGPAGAASLVPRCPFPSDEGEYRILVAPFNKEGSCGTIDEAYAVSVIKAIQRIKKKDDLRVSVRYQPDLCMEQTDNSEALTGDCHADLVLGGAWRSGVSQGETHLQMFYLLSPNSEEEILVEGKGIRLEIHGTETLPAESILLEDVTNFVYWASAMRNMKRGYYDEAVYALEQIEASRPEMQSLIVKMMTKSLVEGGRYQQALAYFDELINDDPQNDKLYTERGNIHLNMGWPQKALMDYDVALGIEPGNSQTLIYRAEALTARGQYAQALVDVDKLIDEFGQLSALYMTRANIYQKMGKLREAQLDYENAISTDPNNADAYVGRAQILRQMGNLSGARAAINQALSHQADHPEANLFNASLLFEDKKWQSTINEVDVVLARHPSAKAYSLRAQAYERTGNKDAALKDYRSASKLAPADIENWISIGLLTLEEGKTQDALNAYKRAIDLKSGDPNLFCLRGDVYTKLKRYPEALADYNNALAINGSYVKAYHKRGLMYLKQQQKEKALKDVETALSLDEDNEYALLARGQIKLDNGDFEDAFEDFNKAIDINEKLPEAYYSRAIAYQEKNMIDLAQDDFDKAVELGGKQLDAYLYLGDALLSKGDPNEALNRFNQAVNYAPESPEPYRHRALYYRSQNDLPKAIQDYDKLIALQGEATAEDYLNRGELFRISGNKSQAIVDYNQAILLAPKWAKAYNTRGDLYTSMGRSQKAIADYNTASTHEPESPVPHLKRAGLHAILKENTLAFEAVEQAIQLSPTYAEAYNTRGLLYLAMGSPEKALEDFQQSLTLDPENANAYALLGKQEIKKGHFTSATSYFDQAILYDPNHADALYQRGFLRFLEKNYSSAMSDLEASIRSNPQNGLAYGTMAKIFASLKEEEKMYYYLDLALKNKYPSIELSYEPIFKPFKEDSRMQELMEKYPK